MITQNFKHFIALLFLLFSLNFILLCNLSAQTTKTILLQDQKHLIHRFGEERYRMFREKDDPLFRQQQIIEQPFNITATGDSLNVRLVGRWANGPSYAIAVERNIAYFGNGAYLEFMDFSDPSHPVELGKKIIVVPINYIANDGNYTSMGGLDACLRGIEVSSQLLPSF